MSDKSKSEVQQDAGEKTNISFWHVFGVVVIVGFLVQIFAGDPTLKAQDYQDKWPLTVDEVTLKCTIDGHPYVETVDGRMYGLTGKAQTGTDYLDNINLIWDKPKSVQWMIDMAKSEVC